MQPEKRSVSDSMIVHDEKGGDTVHLTLGGIWILKLDAIPGTGYAWTITRNNDQFLELLGEPIFTPKTEDSTEKIIGVSAYQEFRFRAKKTGRTQLELDYRRKWEKGAAPLKKFAVTVHIQKGKENKPRRPTKARAAPP